MKIPKKIYKFPIKRDLQMPPRAEVLRVGLQFGEPFLWALFVEPEVGAAEIRHFEIFGTGQDIPMSATYVGGYQEIVEYESHIGETSAKTYEWHVFETKD